VKCTQCDKTQSSQNNYRRKKTEEYRLTQVHAKMAVITEVRTLFITYTIIIYIYMLTAVINTFGMEKCYQHTQLKYHHHKSVIILDYVSIQVSYHKDEEFDRKTAKCTAVKQQVAFAGQTAE